MPSKSDLVHPVSKHSVLPIKIVVTIDAVVWWGSNRACKCLDKPKDAVVVCWIVLLDDFEQTFALSISLIEEDVSILQIPTSFSRTWIATWISCIKSKPWTRWALSSSCSHNILNVESILKSYCGRTWPKFKLSIRRERFEISCTVTTLFNRIRACNSYTGVSKRLCCRRGSTSV